MLVILSGQAFCRMLLNGDLPMIFLGLDRGYGVFEGRPQKESAILITSYQEYMLVTGLAGNDVSPGPLVT